MSITVYQSPAEGRNSPKLSSDGRYRAAGNGELWVSDLLLYSQEVRLFGDDTAKALYQMGFWFDVDSLEYLLALEMLSFEQSIVWAFDPRNQWVKRPIATGPFSGTGEKAGGKTWSIVGCPPHSPIVNGKNFTPTMNQSGWEQDGDFCAYALPDSGFKSIAVQKISTGETKVYTPPGDGEIEYFVFDINGAGVLTARNATASYLYDWDWPGDIQPVIVNLPALVAAGIGESAAQVAAAPDGMLIVATWGGGDFMHTYVRPVGSARCISVPAPGEYMSFRATAAQFTIAANDDKAHVWESFISTDTPLEDPVIPTAPPVAGPPPTPRRPIGVMPRHFWQCWMESITPESHYGRIDLPTNAQYLGKDATFDMLYRPGPVFAGMDSAPGVPDEFLIAILGGISEGGSVPDPEALKAAALYAMKRGVPLQLLVDGYQYFQRPDWVAIADALKRPGLEIILWSERYPRQGMSRGDIVDIWRAEDEFLLARGDRFAQSSTSYDQSQPDANGNPKPGFGYDINLILDLQPDLADGMRRTSANGKLFGDLKFAGKRYGGLTTRPALMALVPDWVKSVPDRPQQPRVILSGGIPPQPIPDPGPVDPPQPGRPDPPPTNYTDWRAEEAILHTAWRRKYNSEPGWGIGSLWAWRRFGPEAWSMQRMLDEM